MRIVSHYCKEEEYKYTEINKEKGTEMQKWRINVLDE